MRKAHVEDRPLLDESSGVLSGDVSDNPGPTPLKRACPPCGFAPSQTDLAPFRGEARALGVSVYQRQRALTSSVVGSSIAIVCWRACNSNPLLRISASFGPSAVRANTETAYSARREADLVFDIDRNSGG